MTRRYQRIEMLLAGEGGQRGRPGLPGIEPHKQPRQHQPQAGVGDHRPGQLGIDLVHQAGKARNFWPAQFIHTLRARGDADLLPGARVSIAVRPEAIELRPGEIFDFTVNPGADRENAEEIRSVDVNYQDLVNDIKVGDTVVFSVGAVAKGSTITAVSSNPSVFEVTSKGTNDGTVALNAGGKAIAAGTAKVTLTTSGSGAETSNGTYTLVITK